MGLQIPSNNATPTVAFPERIFFQVFLALCDSNSRIFIGGALCRTRFFRTGLFLRQNTSGIPRQSTSGFTTPAVAFCHKTKRNRDANPHPGLSLIVSFFPCSECSQYSAVFCVTFWQVSSDPLQPFPGDFFHFLLHGTAEDTPVSAKCPRISQL